MPNGKNAKSNDGRSGSRSQQSRTKNVRQQTRSDSNNFQSPAAPPKPANVSSKAQTANQRSTPAQDRNPAPMRVPRLPRGAQASPTATKRNSTSTRPPGSADGGTSLETHAFAKLESKSNPYYSTLKDPFNVNGVRIPDSVNYPSSTFTVVKRVTLTAGTAGIVAIGLGWFANSGGTANGAYLVPLNDTGAANAYMVGQTNNSSSSIGDIFGSTDVNVNNFGVYFDQWKAGTLTIPGLYNKVRLVSAGIAVNSTASPNTLQGVWRAGFAAPGFYFDKGGTANAVTFDNIGQLPDSVEVPINMGTGVTVTYSPMDLSCLDYVEMSATSAGTIDKDAATLGSLFVAGSGLVSGTTCTVLISFNYEGIPKSNALNFITIQPSIDDPIALASALNRREEDAWSFSGTKEAVRLENDGHPMHARSEEEDVMKHTSTGVLTTKKKPGTSKSLLTEEKEQVSFLESVMTTIFPLLEGGTKALMQSL